MSELFPRTAVRSAIECHLANRLRDKTQYKVMYIFSFKHGSRFCWKSPRHEECFVSKPTNCGSLIFISHFPPSHHFNSWHHVSLQAVSADGAGAGLREVTAPRPRCLLTLVTAHPMVGVTPRGLTTVVTAGTSGTTRNTTGGRGGARSPSSLSPCFYSRLLSCFFYLWNKYFVDQYFILAPIIPHFLPNQISDCWQ